jgi:large exoprotein involved in heme utilization and adhesion
VIHGLIQVTGGSSNLFLMNPAGIVFGANASLNVPAAFTATTANGIQIGNQWFGTATSASALSTLTGTPNAFAFTTAQPGSIFNAGNLAVNQGQSITLIGGTVVNTGVLAAPGGTVTIAAIPGEKLVRLSPSGGVLSLDLPTEVKASVDGTMQPLTPLSGSLF